MSKRIALFNHKGGVSKTTTTFNLGWMLALKGKRVIMVDADPQCNLTGLVLGEDEFEEFYENNKNGNLKKSLSPAFEAQPKMIEAVDCIAVKDRENNTDVEGLFLLPGHFDLSEYEVTLGIAQELSGSLQTLKDLPGAFSYLFEETAKKYNADYILVDTQPSLSSINQNLIMTSDYFLLPMLPNCFSDMALKSLIKILPKWADWAKKAMSTPILSEATYPFPHVIPKFLGIIVQKYHEQYKRSSESFQKWIDSIVNTTSADFINSLKGKGMTLTEEKYEKVLGKGKYLLANFSDFNTLIALSQTYQTPVFALSDEQLGYSGVVLDTVRASRDKFEKVFSKLADSVIRLTE